MTKPVLKDLEELVREIVFPFYELERDVPFRFRPGRRENDAEHSWSVALFACALAPQIDPVLDVGRICQFAVVHDLVEIYAGDTSNFASEAEKATKTARERGALEKLRENFRKFPWIAETITAYEAQSSPEARFVKSIDKVLLLLFDYLEQGFFYKERKITEEDWKANMQKHREKAAKHPGAFAYYEEIREHLLANPQFFYQNERAG